MNIRILAACTVACSFCLLPAQAEDQTAGEKASAIWQKTKRKTKEVTHKVVDKTKETAARVEAAIVDKPDADAKTVEVTVTDTGIQMPKSLAAGKTAFVVKNSGDEKHNFEIEGNDMDKSFWLAIAPQSSKTMQVDLKPGTYQAICKLHDDKEQKVRLTVK